MWETKQLAKSRKHRVPYRINPRRNRPRNTVVKLMKIKDQRENMKRNEEKATK